LISIQQVDWVSYDHRMALSWVAGGKAILLGMSNQQGVILKHEG
jgi:hypothetical protein